MTTTASRLRAHGLGVSPPRGWDAQIYRRSPDGDGSTTHPVLHAATIPLPRGRGDFGTGAVELLGPDDVLVALVEYDAASATTPLFSRRGMPTPTAGDFHPRGLQRTLPGQSGAQWFFNARGRAFCLYVVLGSHTRRALLMPKVRELLAGLVVD
jgi:hypothetical protein